MLSSNSMLTTVLAGGGATGVTEALAAESAPVPTALVAATVNVYAVPFVSTGDRDASRPGPVLIAVCAVAPMYGVTV